MPGISFVSPAVNSDSRACTPPRMSRLCACSIMGAVSAESGRPSQENRVYSPLGAFTGSRQASPPGRTARQACRRRAPRV